MRDRELQRKERVDYQIRRRGITNQRVLAAMEKVPRHRFLPNPEDSQAYEDTPLSIGSSQTISQPFMVALMTDLLDLDGDERVLEIGTGSGYQAAILGELARSVVTVERFASLADRARAVLGELGCRNVTVVIGDGTLGYPQGSPYDLSLIHISEPTRPY